MNYAYHLRITTGETTQGTVAGVRDTAHALAVLLSHYGLQQAHVVEATFAPAARPAGTDGPGVWVVQG